MGKTATDTKQIKKRMILLRHSRKDKRRKYKDMIGHRGMAYARKVGRSHIRGRKITNVFISALMRTCQTAMALIEGAGDCTCIAGPTVKNILGMPMSEWVAHCPTGKESLADIERIDPTFIRNVSTILHSVAVEIFNETQENGIALVVGHTPPLELMVRILTTSLEEHPRGITIAPLNELEGVVLALWDDGSVTIEEEIRHTA